AAGVGDDSPPGDRVGWRLEMQALRCLAATSDEQVAKLIGGKRSGEERRRGLESYRRLRAQAKAHEIEPEPGYRAGYLELLDETLRDGVRTILDHHFEPAPQESYARMLTNTRIL